MSVTDVKATPYAQRTVAHWRVLLDWDPMDPQGLLYLTSNEYTVHTRTLARAGISITVVARPGTVKPVPTKTPPEYPADSLDGIFYDESTQKWMEYHYEKGAPRRSVSGSGSSLASDFSLHMWGEGQTVEATDRNIVAVMVLWTRAFLHYLNFKQPGTRIGQIMPYLEHLRILLRHNGPAFTIRR